MAYTDLNSEDRLVQKTFADHLHDALGWDSVYAWKQETFGPDGTLGRTNTRDVVLTRDLLAAMRRLNPALSEPVLHAAIELLTTVDYSRSLLQHNQLFYTWICEGVPVAYRDEQGTARSANVRLLDFDNPTNNRFLAVRELVIQGRRIPNYNRRADLVCFVNGLPIVFIELKAVHVDVRAGFDNNLRDYLHEHVIAHAFHHNAFLVVSNGHVAKYGSITSGWDHFTDWRRDDESDNGGVEAERLLNGMLAKHRLLDIVRNFILFDASRPGGVRKVVARNQQILGVNLAVDTVARQLELKAALPLPERTAYRIVPFQAHSSGRSDRSVKVVERAHKDLGQLGVFWHTQGSGKSYSMVFFAEKVRRTLPGTFTFVLMTDRLDLDKQLHQTFIGCGAADERTPRAATGKDLQRLLTENHRYIFSVIHKFNQDVDPEHPYSTRDDIIVVSDEAHRTQAGKLARNMRLALPNAAFLGFTGTPLFQHDHLTRRLFGPYVSRYDFKRSEEDGSTVKLIYQNRGEKLGVARVDLNDRIAEIIEQAELTDEKRIHLEKLLGKDYEVLTSPDRLDKVAADFVELAAKRWQAGKAMLVCIDKPTCARMLTRILPRWATKTQQIRELAAAEPDPEARGKLVAQADWMSTTIVGLIISEAQNEVQDLGKWGFDIIPHRVLMKNGFETPDGKRIDVESAFKNPDHPFRIAVVCAMWLTGFDVECLSTLYIDKPMKAHTLMQAIARANRRFPGKDSGLIVDYNGMLAALRAALAQYAVGDDLPPDPVVAPIEERVSALVDALEVTEAFLSDHGFDVATLVGLKGFDRIGALGDAVEAVSRDDPTRHRFEILARQVFSRFKALVTEPSAYEYARRHDDLECIYKHLTDKHKFADITDVLQALQGIVSQAIQTHAAGADQTEARSYDLSQIDFDKLREEFAKRVRRKATAIQDIRLVVEQKLAQMLQQNPLRMDYYRRYTEIVAAYNNDKDRVTLEDTFAQLLKLVDELSAEDRRAVEEQLSEEELALFDVLNKDKIGGAERERVKLASRELLASVLRAVAAMDQWTAKPQTQAVVETLVADKVFELLPTPPFSRERKAQLASEVYRHLWQRGASGLLLRVA